MTTAEFKKVGRLLKEVYKQLEAEALADGVDIFGEEFITVRDALREEVLKRLGFTLEEYREAKALVAPAKKIDVATQLENVATETSAIKESVQNLHIPDEEELLAKAKVIAEEVVKAPVIQNNIVERTIVEKPTHVHTTVKETVNKEFDANPIYAELGYLNDRLDNLPPVPDVDSKIEQLRSEMKNDFALNFEDNINTLGMPDFRKLGMGLQAQIDEVRSGSTQDALTGLTASVVELNYTDGVTSAIQTQLDNKLDDTQFSGLSKITVGTTEPVAPATNDLWVDCN